MQTELQHKLLTFTVILSWVCDSVLWLHPRLYLFMLAGAKNTFWTCIREWRPLCYVQENVCPSSCSPGPSCAVALQCWQGFPSFLLRAEKSEYEGNKSAVLGLAELQIHQGFILLCLPLFTFGSHGMSHLSYWGSHSQDIWPEYIIFEVIYPIVCFHFYWCGSFDSLESFQSFGKQTPICYCVRSTADEKKMETFFFAFKGAMRLFKGIG